MRSLLADLAPVLILFGLLIALLVGLIAWDISRHASFQRNCAAQGGHLYTSPLDDDAPVCISRDWRLIEVAP